MKLLTIKNKILRIAIGSLDFDFVDWASILRAALVLHGNFLCNLLIVSVVALWSPLASLSTCCVCAELQQSLVQVVPNIFFGMRHALNVEEHWFSWDRVNSGMGMFWNVSEYWGAGFGCALRLAISMQHEMHCSLILKFFAAARQAWIWCGTFLLLLWLMIGVFKCNVMLQHY